jgi:hypothetical protein
MRNGEVVGVSREMVVVLLYIPPYVGAGCYLLGWVEYD